MRHEKQIHPNADACTIKWVFFNKHPSQAVTDATDTSANINTLFIDLYYLNTPSYLLKKIEIAIFQNNDQTKIVVFNFRFVSPVWIVKIFYGNRESFFDKQYKKYNI